MSGESFTGILFIRIYIYDVSSESSCHLILVSPRWNI
jgi:hypothetical protein